MRRPPPNSPGTSPPLAWLLGFLFKAQEKMSSSTWLWATKKGPKDKS